ncbi:hypothetical protein P7K49_035879 [Saguinus oedipus]|uniref:Uncharacterized protein n=1 Tax=Saguinus oedipus TaxID=9490 RepID=A0ABQ9TP76_SAGOE|nr:hypothetical protein P7K49_035879 [Saguinus oedipus]
MPKQHQALAASALSIPAPSSPEDTERNLPGSVLFFPRWAAGRGRKTITTLAHGSLCPSSRAQSLPLPDIHEGLGGRPGAVLGSLAQVFIRLLHRHHHTHFINLAGVGGAEQRQSQVISGSTCPLPSYACGLPASSSPTSTPPDEGGKKKYALIPRALAHQPSPPQPPVSALSPAAFLNSWRPLCSKGAPRPLRRGEMQGGEGAGAHLRGWGLLTHPRAQLALAPEPLARQELLQAATAPTPAARQQRPEAALQPGWGATGARPGHPPASSPGSPP